MQIRQASGEQICFQGRPVRPWKFDGNRRKIMGMGGEPRYRAAPIRCWQIGATTGTPTVPISKKSLDPSLHADNKHKTYLRPYT